MLYVSLSVLRPRVDRGRNQLKGFTANELF